MNKTMECLDLSRILNFGDDVKKTDESVDHGGQERIRHGNDPHLDLSDLAGRRHDAQQPLGDEVETSDYG